MEIELIKDFIVQGIPRKAGDKVEVGPLMKEKLVKRGAVRLSQQIVKPKTTKKG